MHETKKKHFLLPKLTQVGADGDKDQARLSCPTLCVRLSVIIIRKSWKQRQGAFSVYQHCVFFLCSDWLNAQCLGHLDWSLQLWLLITEPHHPDDRHGDAEPVEEAEEVYDGEDVIGEGVEQRHQALERVRGKQFSVQYDNVFFLIFMFAL